MDVDLMDEMEVIGRSKGESDKWYDLKWKPIKNCSWNFWARRRCSSYRDIGFRISKSHQGNHGVAYDGFSIELFLWLWTVDFWVHWNFKMIIEDECR